MVAKFLADWGKFEQVFFPLLLEQIFFLQKNKVVPVFDKLKRSPGKVSYFVMSPCLSEIAHFSWVLVRKFITLYPFIFFFWKMNCRPWKFSYLLYQFWSPVWTNVLTMFEASLLREISSFLPFIPMWEAKKFCEKPLFWVWCSISAYSQSYSCCHWDYGMNIPLSSCLIVTSINITCSHLLSQYFSLILRTALDRRFGKRLSFSLVNLSLSLFKMLAAAM